MRIQWYFVCRIVLTYCGKKCFSDQEYLFQIWPWSSTKWSLNHLENIYHINDEIESRFNKISCHLLKKINNSFSHTGTQLNSRGEITIVNQVFKYICLGIWLASKVFSSQFWCNTFLQKCIFVPLMKMMQLNIRG